MVRVRRGTYDHKHRRVIPIAHVRRNRAVQQRPVPLTVAGAGLRTKPCGSYATAMPLNIGLAPGALIAGGIIGWPARSVCTRAAWKHAHATAFDRQA